MGDRASTLSAYLLTITVVLTLAVIWVAAHVLFLFFAGMLFAIALRSASNFIRDKALLSDGWALSVTLVLLLSLATVTVWIALPSIVRQSSDLQRELPAAWDNLVSRVSQLDLGEVTADETHYLPSTLSIRKDIAPRVFGFASSFLGGITAALIIFFSGVYLAFAPASYRHGLVLLFPRKYEQTIDDLLLKIGNILRWWLLGRLISMLVVGVFIWVGLGLLEVPLAPILALLSALLTFIPNIGPVIAAVPSVLLGFTQGADTALYVLLLNLLVQGVESYVLAPYLQKATVSLSPAFTLFVQAMMGILFGGIAVAVATPLAAAGVVVFDELWVKKRRNQGAIH